MIEAASDFVTAHWLAELIAGVIAFVAVRIYLAIKNAPTYDDMDR